MRDGTTDTHMETQTLPSPRGGGRGEEEVDSRGMGVSCIGMETSSSIYWDESEHLAVLHGEEVAVAVWSVFIRVWVG